MGASAKSSDPVSPARVAVGFGPRWLRIGLGVAAVIYLLSIFLGSAGSSMPDRLLPGEARYFTQIACLFPRAKEFDIEYRVQGFSCRTSKFAELDHRPYFPIHADDKESRFVRLGQFFRRNKTVMSALEDYLISRHNARVAALEAPPPGVDGEPIGGIMFLSLRVPVPPPGAPTRRYEPLPLRQYPRSVERKYWYTTSKDVRQERCAAVETP